MIRKLDLEDTETLRQILELQLASYKVEAEMIGFYDIPPLKDTMDSLKECGEIFYGYYAGNVLAGIISYKVDENVLDIHRVAIHPNFFRMGIADKLVRFIESIEKNIMEITVCTGKENLPAVNLYLKNGYKKAEDIQIAESIYLTEFRKSL